MTADDTERCDHPECDGTEPDEGGWRVTPGYPNLRFCSADCNIDYWNNHHPDELAGETEEQARMEADALAEAFGSVLVGDDGV